MIGLISRKIKVGEDLRSLVLNTYPDADILFVHRGKEKYLFNLPGFVEILLRAAGIQHVHNLNIDTYGKSSGLFSHRQAMHAASPDSGRQMSIIGICAKTGS